MVGLFVLQSETLGAISEALRIFQSWNDEWNPQYSITDYSEAEINAVKNCFDRPIDICDFHREQAWVRWFNKKESISNTDDKAMTLLRFFRNLAHSKSDEEFAEIENEIKETSAWTNNPKAQKYFLSTWLPVKQMWTHAFF